MESIVSIDSVLLELIKSKNHFISADNIAQSLNISKIDLYQRIQQLQHDGYLIELKNEYVCLQDPLPYNIIPEQIMHFLQIDPKPKIFFTPQAISTNTIAKEIVYTYQQSFILITRNQTAGRGRINRSWQMIPDQDIAMSLAIPCDIPQNILFSIIRLASLSVCKVLNSYSNNQCSIKWPNDIILHNKKICGILVENILENNAVKYIVIGIGVNINSMGLPDYAISLKDLINKDVDINQFCAKVIDLLTTYWNDFPTNQEYIMQEWEELLSWKNEIVSLKYHDQEFVGVLTSVDFDGSIILEIDKKECKFFSGDLTSIKLKQHL